MLIRLQALMVLLPLVVCNCGDDAGSGTGGAGETGGANSGGGPGSGAGSATGGTGGTGAGGMTAMSGGGGNGGDVGSGGQGGAQPGDLLVGTWRPTEMANGQNPPQPVPADSPFFIFDANGDYSLGCNEFPSATWVWDENAPEPAIAVIHVTFDGGSLVDWYVTELDNGKFTFVEGGDFFFFQRDVCN